MSSTASVGRYGEDVAARYLSAQGYEILARNWRSPRREMPGELDIVAKLADKHGVCLVFCEVKTRRSITAGTPAEAVTPEKMRRLRRLAGIWLSMNSVRTDEIRIDVISVLRPKAGPARITHLVGVV